MGQGAGQLLGQPGEGAGGLVASADPGFTGTGMEKVVGRKATGTIAGDAQQQRIVREGACHPDGGPHAVMQQQYGGGGGQSAN